MSTAVPAHPSVFRLWPHRIARFYWRPNRDLAAVGVSWVLVVAALYTATFVIGRQAVGGLAYFGMYALVGAVGCGIAIPLVWTVAVRRRPVSDLGITREALAPSLLLQVLFAGLLFVAISPNFAAADLASLAPLVALALCIGFFEAVFWRGWVLRRLEDSFGLLPAILVGSALYAAYHIGYGMGTGEIASLFFIGIMFSLAFSLTNSVFILWPLFQPLGQLVTLVRDGLDLPLLAALGFLEALALMWLLIYLAQRYYRRNIEQAAAG